MRLDYLVVTVTRLLPGRFVVQFPAGEADFFVFQSGPRSRLLDGYRELFTPEWAFRIWGWWLNAMPRNE